jgi:uncharacterized protein (DUF1697 family)
MFRFIAFLRGINVGGHIVGKEKLIEAFTSLGFQNVLTYKQSGNVIFEAASADPEKVTTIIEDKLRLNLGYEVVVRVRTFPQLEGIVRLDPFKNQSRDGTSFLVTFLPQSPSTFPFQLPITISKSNAQVISAMGREVFSVTHGGGEGALPNPFLESKLKVKTTTRNMNIIREIVEKFA